MKPDAATPPCKPIATPACVTGSSDTQSCAPASGRGGWICPTRPTSSSWPACPHCGFQPSWRSHVPPSPPRQVLRHAILPFGPEPSGRKQPLDRPLQPSSLDPEPDLLEAQAGAGLDVGEDLRADAVAVGGVRRARFMPAWPFAAPTFPGPPWTPPHLCRAGQAQLRCLISIDQIPNIGTPPENGLDRLSTTQPGKVNSIEHSWRLEWPAIGLTIPAQNPDALPAKRISTCTSKVSQPWQVEFS